MELKDLYGKKILSASIDDSDLSLELEGFGKVNIYDDGQSCCEQRYMSCDDNPDTLVGGVITGIELKEADCGGINDDYAVHECMFVEVQTDKGFITLTTHNIHNGYYGGFSIRINKQ